MYSVMYASKLSKGMDAYIKKLDSAFQTYNIVQLNDKKFLWCNKIINDYVYEKRNTFNNLSHAGNNLC